MTFTVEKQFLQLTMWFGETLRPGLENTHLREKDAVRKWNMA